MASTVVAPSAFCAIALHAAIPICHSCPTLPLVEAAIGVLAEQTIVGWYTGSPQMDDITPSASALRMVESLETSNIIDPVLLIVQNRGLAACVNGTASPASELLQAIGKDNTMQWTKHLSLNIEDLNKATKATLEALQQKYRLDDFEDHLEGPATAPFPDKELAKLVSKMRG
ncbi:hypothetical protein MPSEU_000475900 [Mayamaea pseudoterrestris]|nr:hypothetical protein MPSEU_000475900 [Mayamaea pseudoterrestris]